MSKEIDLSTVKTISIHNRKSKVTLKEMAQLHKPGNSFKSFLDSLPLVLKAEDFKAVVEAVVFARKNNKPVVWMMGAHVIKCGLSPVVIDLMEEKVITAVCMNGAGAIHDLELACFGHTSEDVAENLVNGTFGMAQETAEIVGTSKTKVEKARTILDSADKEAKQEVLEGKKTIDKVQQA